jgi:hypothetical protein
MNAEIPRTTHYPVNGETEEGEMRAQHMYDVVAVNIQTGRVRLMAESKDHDNAEAIVTMAVMRRGVEEEFYSKVPAGAYHEGDEWTGKGK